MLQTCGLCGDHVCSTKLLTNRGVTECCMLQDKAAGDKLGEVVILCPHYFHSCTKSSLDRIRQTQMQEKLEGPGPGYPGKSKRNSVFIVADQSSCRKTRRYCRRPMALPQELFCTVTIG
jgi:hypothetical protein